MFEDNNVAFEEEGFSFEELVEVCDGNLREYFARTRCYLDYDSEGFSQAYAKVVEIVDAQIAGSEIVGNSSYLQELSNKEQNTLYKLNVTTIFRLLYDHSNDDALICIEVAMAVDGSHSAIIFRLDKGITLVVVFDSNSVMLDIQISELNVGGVSSLFITSKDTFTVGLWKAWGMLHEIFGNPHMMVNDVAEYLGAMTYEASLNSREFTDFSVLYNHLKENILVPLVKAAHAEIGKPPTFLLERCEFWDYFESWLNITPEKAWVVKQKEFSNYDALMASEVWLDVLMRASYSSALRVCTAYAFSEDKRCLTYMDGEVVQARSFMFTVEGRTLKINVKGGTYKPLAQIVQEARQLVQIGEVD